MISMLLFHANMLMHSSRKGVWFFLQSFNKLISWISVKNSSWGKIHHIGNFLKHSFQCFHMHCIIPHICLHMFMLFFAHTTLSICSIICRDLWTKKLANLGLNGCMCGMLSIIWLHMWANLAVWDYIYNLVFCGLMKVKQVRADD